MPLRSAIILSTACACALVAGCASGEAEEPTRQTEIAETGARSDAARADVARDVRDEGPSADAATTTDGHTLIFPVEDPKTCGVPAGTTAIASASADSTPQRAFDGSLGTYWNSGSNTGTLVLTFPGPITFDRVRIAAFGVPATNHTYGFAASNGLTETNIGTATRDVPSTTAAWLEPMVVTRGAWKTLTVDVSMSQSWIALAEVTVYDSNAGCP